MTINVCVCLSVLSLLVHPSPLIIVHCLNPVRVLCVFRLLIRSLTSRLLNCASRVLWPGIDPPINLNLTSLLPSLLPFSLSPLVRPRFLFGAAVASTTAGHFGLSASAESVHLIRRTSSRRGAGYLGCSGAGNGEPRSSRHHPHRSSSRRNKENGSRPGSFKAPHQNNGAGQQAHLRSSNQQNISNSSINAVGGVKAENIMRRNSKASEELMSEERRAKNDQDVEEEEDGTEQSQKKQRIVSFDQGSSDRLVSLMDTSAAAALVEQALLAADGEDELPLNRQPRV